MDGVLVWWTSQSQVDPVSGKLMIFTRLLDLDTESPSAAPF